MLSRRSVLAIATLLVLTVAVAAVIIGTAAQESEFAYTQDPYHPDHRVDVEHYTFRLELSDASDEIAGHASVHIAFRESGVDTVRLDLVGMSVSDVTLSEMALSEPGTRDAPNPDDARPVAFDHKDGVLSMPLERTARKGERLRIEVKYAGVPEDGLIISQNKHGARTFFGDNWPNRARHWLPTVDHVSEKATVSFEVTAPNHYQVIASGELVEEVDVDDTRRLSRYNGSVPIPPKVMVIGVARFAVEESGVVDGVPISSWVYPEDRENGFREYARAVQVAEYFIDQIGPFPYAKLGNVQSTTRYGGMENAGNIFYSENSVSGTGASEGLIAHEIAHQWFGDSVTEADWYHIWLSEGFATYFTQLYMEHAYGRERMNTGLVAQRTAIIRYHQRNPDSPVIDTTIVDLNDLLSTNSYQKGGWVLHMLRQQVGTADFWEGIRTYYERHRDTNALTRDLHTAMEDASGQELDWFFDQWLRRAGHPQIDVTWSNAEDGGVSVLVRQLQEGGPFRFPLDIAFASSDSTSEPVTVTLDVTEQQQTFQVDPGVQSATAELDPNVWLLMEGDITYSGRR